MTFSPCYENIPGVSVDAEGTANTPKGYISGDAGILKQKVRLENSGDLSAVAELRVAKQLRSEGYDVRFIADMAGERTNDFTVNGIL